MPTGVKLREDSRSTSTSLAVRPASLPEEREELIAILERNTPGFPWRAHFKWRHDENPAGPGWSWVVWDRQSGAIRAMASLFPRPMFCNGKRVLCGQVGEFAVDSAYRSLGPAVMLQRATFQPVDSGALTLCYDCPPHDQGMSTFVRLGLHANCEVTRYAFPLRSDEAVEKRMGKAAWTKPFIVGANLMLSIRRSHHAVSGLEIQLLESSFGEEFSRLDETVPSSGMIRSSRSAELLRWRYRERPEEDVRVLVARRNGELLAFLAFIIYPNERATILDLFGRELNEIGLALLDAALDECRRKDVVCLEGYSSDTSGLKAIFRAAGFSARERAARVIAYSKPNGSLGGMQVSWPFGQAELFA